jgi:hypothetical protein
MKPRLEPCILELLRVERVPYGELNWWEPRSCLQAVKDIKETSSITHFNVLSTKYVSFLPALAASCAASCLADGNLGIQASMRLQNRLNSMEIWRIERTNFSQYHSRTSYLCQNDRCVQLNPTCTYAINIMPPAHNTIIV